MNVLPLHGFEPFGLYAAHKPLACAVPQYSRWDLWLQFRIDVQGVPLIGPDAALVSAWL